MPACLAWSVVAADEALDGLAFAEALGHAERALELWSEVSGAASLAGRDERSLWMLAARSAAALGRWTRAADLGRATLALLDPIGRRDERIRFLLDLSEWEAFADDETARAAAIREAAELVPTDTPSALLARVLTSRAHLAAENGRFDEARRLATEARQMSQALGARTEEGWALLRLAELHGELQPDAADRLLAEAVQIAAEGDGDFDDLASHLVFRQADFALGQGAFARAIEAAEGGIVRAARAGRSGQLAAFLRVIKIEALGALGRWDEAEILAVEAGRDAEVMTARMATQGFVAVLIRQGRIAEALAAVQATDSGYVTPHEGTSSCQPGSAWRTARVVGTTLEPLPRRGSRYSMFRRVIRSSVSWVGLALVGEADRAELARGRRRKAEEADARRVGFARLELLREASAYAIRLGDAGARIPAELATAEAEGSRLKRRSDAKLWDDAAGRREALGQPWEIAYADSDRPRPSSGRPAASKMRCRCCARPTGSPRGLVHGPSSIRSRGSLAARGLGSRRYRRVGGRERGQPRRAWWSRLTTREWEALSLVAAGHTHREIGDESLDQRETASGPCQQRHGKEELRAREGYEAASIATHTGSPKSPTALVTDWRSVAATTEGLPMSA